MNRVYCIKPLEKKSISWHIEMYRKNNDGTISWFNVDDHYRWGQGFIEEDMDCNLPWQGDATAHAKTDCGWGSELDDQHACWFEFSDDIDDEEQEEIKQCYLEGDGDQEFERSGAAWLFDGDHMWQLEDDYLEILAPFQVDLCEEDGTIVQENIKLRTRPTHKEIKASQIKNADWPFSSNSSTQDD